MKEAADMVLTDDDFASIEAAVGEVRGVFDDVQQSLVGTFGLFEWTLAQGEPVATARTVAVNVFVVVQVAHPLDCRSLDRSMLHAGLRSNRRVVAGMTAMPVPQPLFTYTPSMNQPFGTAPMHRLWWLWITGGGIVVHVLVEGEKWLRRQPSVWRTAATAGHRDAGPG